MFDFRNPKVQFKALNLGLIQYLLHLLNTESDETIIYRLLFTLSTLLRNFPQGQMTFFQHSGVESMNEIIKNQNNKIAVRALTLMSDLIIEKVKFNEYLKDLFHFHCIGSSDKQYTRGLRRVSE